MLLLGCVSDPVMTGKPQHWRGKSADSLRASWGEPTRIIRESERVEVWEYVKSGDFIAPGRERTDFNVGPKPFGGATGGITTLKQGERISEYENIRRFKIKDGKVTGWYAARMEGGRVVWEDH